MNPIFTEAYQFSNNVCIMLDMNAHIDLFTGSTPDITPLSVDPHVNVKMLEL